MSCVDSLRLKQSPWGKYPMVSVRDVPGSKAEVGFGHDAVKIFGLKLGSFCMRMRKFLASSARF